MKRALAIREKALGSEHPEVATSIGSLASLFQAQGHYADTEPLMKRALAINEKALGPEHPTVGNNLNNLARLYWAQGRYAEAEPLQKRALGIVEKALGQEHPAVGSHLTILALVYKYLGRYAEAEPLYKRALAISEKALGPEHTSVGTGLNNLAALYEVQRQYAQAEPLYKRALAINEKALGPEHPTVGINLNNLAKTYLAQGRYVEAEPLMMRALGIGEKALGPEHPNFANSLSTLAALYEKQGRAQDAERSYRRALGIQEKVLGPDHPGLASTRANLGALYKSQGRYEEAEPLLRSVLDIREKAFGPDHRFVASSLTQLGELYRLQGHPDEAEMLFRRALAIRKAEIREVPVLFGTDRKQDKAGKSVAFNGERAETLSFGRAFVVVPKPLPQGGLGQQEFSDPQASRKSRQIDDTTEMARLTIRQIELTDDRQLVDLARDKVMKARAFQQHVFVFVHGFNVSFENALRRTAQIAYDMDFDSAPFLFTWPSRASLWGYGYDRDSADLAADHLMEFLERVVAQTKATKIDLIAHSMGNVVLLNALEKIKLSAGSGARLNVGEIILHAPDVDRDRFSQLVTKIRDIGTGITLYSSASDRALGVSRWLVGLTPRAGGTNVVVRGIDTIDTTAAGSSFLGLNHDIYATNATILRDMRLLLERGEHPPHNRSKLFQPEVTNEGTYWVYRPEQV
jgi:esterase/lipase superfamily enzyme/Tfp pilus assembly protein PilF